MGENEFNLTIQLEKRLKHLKKVIEEKKKSTAAFESRYSDYLQSSVQIKKHKKGYQYYLRTKTGGENAAAPCESAGVSRGNFNGKYLKRNEDKLAMAIAQYEYDRKILTRASDEKSICERYLLKNSPSSLTDVYEKYGEGRQQIVRPIEETDLEYIGQWEVIQYEGARPDEEKPEIYTEKGEQVRSKSEVLIADQLYKYGIPYHYEFPRKVKGLGGFVKLSV